MSVYLKQFSTHAEYEAAESSLILPNVSICKDTPNEVHYNPYIAPDPYNGHEYVDLGLPSGTKWAKMNVGASVETDIGNYYQYGKGAAQYAVTSGETNYTGDENPLATSADTAAQVMGGQWHIPTQTQLNELTANTTSEWTTINGIDGRKFIATNGNYVFFPITGKYNNGKLFSVNTHGYYWSSTFSSSNYAYNLFFHSRMIDVRTNTTGDGLAVRGVVDE